MELLQDIEVASEEKRYPLGTRLVIGRPAHRYCQAGDALQKGFPAFVHYEGDLRKDAEGHFIIDSEVSDGIWGDIRATGEKSQMVGWPASNVAKGLFFWLREIL